MIVTTRKIPRLRFPEFRDEWQIKKLNASLMESKKRNFDSKHDRADVLSVSGERGIVNQIEFQGRSFAGVSVANYHTVETGDIVYTKSPLKANPYGIIKSNKGKSGIVSTLYAVYKPIGDASANFLDYYFQLNDNTNRYLRPLVHKGAKNDMKINNTHVLDGSIVVPNGREQEKIADFLTVVDEKIAAGQQKIDLLKKYKKGVMQAIFSQKLCFKDENGKAFPDWEEKKIVELCEIAKSGGTPVATNNSYYRNGSIPFLAISDMTTQGKYLTKTTKFITDLGLKNSASWVVPANSIIYSMYASVGSVAINKIPLATSQAVINLIPNEKIFLEYLYYCLISSYRKISKYIATGTQGNLNAEIVTSFKIPVPSRGEQRKIADFLTALDDKIELENNKLEQAKRFKKALLQQMFV